MASNLTDLKPLELEREVRVAMDAMGGDFGPEVTVPAALQAVKEGGGKLSVVLVGDEKQVRNELERSAGRPDPDGIKVLASEGVALDGERPLEVIARKPNASVFVAAKCVQDGEAEGFFSVGSTGATFMAAQLAYGTLGDMERGVLAGNIFGFAVDTYLMDLGALVDLHPRHFVTLATLGTAVVRWFGVAEPRIAVLNIGTEAGKGNRQMKEATEMLAKSKLNFVGSVEPAGMLRGEADVVLCDGFTGNVALKLTEALGDAVSGWLRERLGNGAEDMIEELHGMTNRGQYYGAAPILGLEGVAMVGHGSFGVEQICKGILFTARTAAYNLVDVQRKALAEMQAEGIE